METKLEDLQEVIVLTHQEMVLLKIALEQYGLCPSNLPELNSELFEKERFKSVLEFNSKKNKLIFNLKEKLSKYRG